MMTIRYSPLQELHQEVERMRSEFDRLFGEARTARWPTLDPRAFPAVNAWEDEECFYVEAELPGLNLDDLEIYVSDQNVLTIKGQRKQPALEGGHWHRCERAYGAFERSLPLPGPVSADDVEATFKQGVLTVKLPKAPEIRPRKIEVKCG